MHRLHGSLTAKHHNFVFDFPDFKLYLVLMLQEIAIIISRRNYSLWSMKYASESNVNWTGVHVFLLVMFNQ